MCNLNFGERLIDGVQDLLYRMRSGQPIPVTELRQVVTPNGSIMVVSNETEIIFGDKEDDQNDRTKGKASEA